ncbi:MAG: translation initiation factor [Oligosphaeraceae bacterium]
MKRKKQQNGESKPALTEQNWNNPFLDLKVDLPEPVKPPPPPPPSPEELRRQALSPEDQALLKAFGETEAITLGNASRGSTPRKHQKITFQLRRKGRGGKTVTCVQGLQSLELAEQMELCSRVKEALGVGARFVEGVLELQGDQIQRAAQWFAREGFSCP